MDSIGTLDPELASGESETRGGEFPAAMVFNAKGDWVSGIYVGDSEFPGKDSKMVKSYLLKLEAYKGVTPTRTKKAVEVKVGDVVALSGSTLAAHLRPTDYGRKVLVTFEGKTPSSKGNDAKVFTVKLGKSSKA